MSTLVEALQRAGIETTLLDGYTQINDVSSKMDVLKKTILLNWTRRNDPPAGGKGQALMDTVKQLDRAYREIKQLSVMLKTLTEWMSGHNIR